ncbi:Uncharacterised protein [Legionella longbeachae]|nr:hypothetical protein LOR_78c22690 [Legionella oakridgensis RV-2-2007]KTD37243.1 hypothetical protein Loak_2379 [Legionella oakridgensis]STY16195.1 Uncharacterised protein [Legionella longbeachae]
MIKKILMTAMCFFIFLPVTSFAKDIDFFKINFKKTFCNNQEFLGNSGAKRPHLHCGVDFMSYKKANGDHLNLTQVGSCNRTNAVFDDVKSNKEAFADYAAIYHALVLYHQADCPNL